jgi:hypothetical protein
MDYSIFRDVKSMYSEKDRYIGYIALFGAIAFVFFWIGWLLGPLKSFSPNESFYDTYIAFETPFLIADIWLIFLCLISGYGILKGKSYGQFFATAAGGAAIFLGLVDISFSILQGLYQHDLLMLPLHLIVILLGVFVLVWFGRYHVLKQ